MASELQLKGSSAHFQFSSVFVSDHLLKQMFERFIRPITTTRSGSARTQDGRRVMTASVHVPAFCRDDNNVQQFRVKLHLPSTGNFLS